MSAEPARRALVTGASSGIGAAAARLLASRGYRVALLARRREALEQVAASLAGHGHLTLPCDVRDESGVRESFAAVGADFGGLDLLVNAAGCGYRGRVEELRLDHTRAVLETNVLGLVVCCREALPLLRGGRNAVVVNVSSVVGRRGIPGQAVYAASKAAVDSIGEALRLEWASEKIAVCTLSPTLTRTGFFAAQPNPAGLPDPDLARAWSAERVALEILALDRRPRPER
ncbi:MAG TPA: SDR family oxidoreductase, partial [Planctomycetota bacterium]|nr:SDR family oxidoreductase [Planctomycetota bacterium]